MDDCRRGSCGGRGIGADFSERVRPTTLEHRSRHGKRPVASRLESHRPSLRNPPALQTLADVCGHDGGWVGDLAESVHCLFCGQCLSYVEASAAQRLLEASGKTQSKKRDWRRERDSNPRYCLGTHAFQACALNHSAISPAVAPLIWRSLASYAMFFLHASEGKSSGMT
jgi:hypothetical protein